MHVLLRLAGIYLLALLLVGTSPLGTDQGAHLGQVLHPVFAHHMASSHEAAHLRQQPVSNDPVSGPALGAGAGAAFAADAGIALAPPFPIAGNFQLPGESRRLEPQEQLPPRGRLEAPASPPPRNTG
jgi:hypothetical protein